MWSASGSDMGPGWDRLRRRVLRESGGVCALCGRSGASEVDHIVSRRRGGGNDLSNLRVLWRGCHARKSSAEGNEQKRRRRMLSKRPTERHPGSV